MAADETRGAGASNRPPLTARQRSVLALIAEGQSNRAIGETLGISENGVKAHVSRLLAKFQAPNRAALVRQARREPGEGVSGHAAAAVIQSSLEEVIGAQASRTLIRRAAKRAGRDWPEHDGSPDISIADLSAVVRELWPLLIQMTGQVLVRRLETRGFRSGGEVELEDVLAWIQ